MKKFDVASSIEEAKDLARKELESLDLKVDLNNLKCEISFGKSSKIYNEDLPMTSAVFSQFKETSIEEAEKCFIDVVNEDGYTARAVISDKNVAKASSVIARAILMSYGDAIE